MSVTHLSPAKEAFNNHYPVNLSSKITEVCLWACLSVWDISVDYFQSVIIEVVTVCEFRLAAPSLLEPVLNSERSVPLFV